MSGVKLLGNNTGNLNWTAAGALCWPVVARDEGRAGALTDCFLGLSRDTFVLIEECTRQIVFVAPTISILGICHTFFLILKLNTLISSVFI